MREMMRSPMMVCCAMVSNSSRVSAAGLLRMLPGIPILPMSCSTAAYCSMRSSASVSPRRLPTATAMAASESACDAVYWSLASMAAASAVTVSRYMRSSFS